MNQLNLDDVYGIWKTSFWQTLPGYAIILLIVILIFLVIGFLYKKIFLSKKNILPENLAKNELNILLNKNFDNYDNKKNAYLKLSQILRKYIQDKYNINKLGMTDLEFLSEIENIKYNLDLKSVVDNIVCNAQMVKFAHAEIYFVDIKKDIYNAIKFIDSTLIEEKLIEKK